MSERRTSDKRTSDKRKKILDDISKITLSEEVTNKLFKYQINPTKNLVYSLRTNGIALEWSDTGTGKSHTGSATAKQEGLKIFVIGPKSSIISWHETAEYWGVECLGVVNYETIKNGKYYSDHFGEQRTDCPYVEVVKEFQEDVLGQPLLNKKGNKKVKIAKVNWKIPNDTLVIVDEAHKGKNGICTAKQSGNSIFMASLKSCLNKERRVYGLILSATISDKIECLDVVLYLLGFYRPYMSDAYMRYLRSIGYNKRENQEIVFKKLNHILFPKYGSRMKTSDAQEKFKKNIVCARPFHVNEEIARKIEEEHEKIGTIINGREIGVAVVEHKFSHISRCWQNIEILKIPTVAEVAQTYLVENKAVVIFVNFIETMNLLNEQLSQNYRVGLIHGKQSLSERENIRILFQNDNIDCLICQIKAGGSCISMHAIGNKKQRVSLLFPTWDAIAFRQALGRIHRAGSSCDAIQIIVYCTSENADYSIEKLICDNINKKLSNIDLINNGDLDGSRSGQPF
jgi:superfamily II DNA or RNA helicase